MTDLAILFKGLADDTRLAMLALLLGHGELCVCDLEHTLGVTQSKASRHLRYLKAAGLLEDRRGAQWVFYRINRHQTEPHKVILAALRRLLRGEAYQRLDRKLEKWLARKSTSGDSCMTAPRGRLARNRRSGALA